MKNIKGVTLLSAAKGALELLESIDNYGKGATATALRYAIQAAEHRVHRTAILFGFIGLGFGIVVGAWLVVVAQIAAR